MFRRRIPIPLWQRVHRWVWPHIGWRRWGAYLFKRLTRLPGTPHSIAAGFACGTAISFTPFIGFHLLGSTLLSFVVRGNYVAAWVGTLIGNPWTFPFIWLFTYKLGLLLLGAQAQEVASAGEEFWKIERLVGDLRHVLWPMTVGGIPAGIAAGLATYFPIARAVSAFHEARLRRRERGRLRRERRLGLRTTSPSAGARVL